MSEFFDLTNVPNLTAPSPPTQPTNAPCTVTRHTLIRKEQTPPPDEFRGRFSFESDRWLTSLRCAGPQSIPRPEGLLEWTILRCSRKSFNAYVRLISAFRNWFRAVTCEK